MSIANVTVTTEELQEAWRLLSPEERRESFSLLAPEDAQEFFLEMRPADQLLIVRDSPPAIRRSWLRLLAPDDAADLLQEAEPEERSELMALLDPATRREVNALLAYEEDDAGGLMSPRYARLRPDMTVDEAIGYLRMQARQNLETINYAYVLDSQQRLLGVMSLRELFTAPGDKRVSEVMNTDLVTVSEDTDQETTSQLLGRHGVIAIPVLDDEGKMKGIVTWDDIVDVVEEEATEDIQKMGGSEALDAPYLQVGLLDMIKKRAGWLSALFIGELLTATAMGYYEKEIARAAVLAIFIPLIISSGGNSGSQATTLIIRALALSEVRLRDWWRVFRRELVSGLGLGGILAVLGFTRIAIWQSAFHTYGEHGWLIATTVALSLVGVVLWGTLIGSSLPFLLRRLGFDPASASAPFVATLVDVTGLIIYFTFASLILRGTLL
ncbi:MAG TPA: magnesium transporter [Thermoanaerobaculia bacterium]|jgi:magnesium transporter|nr:magnesium transporter [Thermoanaerobaculia bacterium]